MLNAAKVKFMLNPDKKSNRESYYERVYGSRIETVLPYKHLVIIVDEKLKYTNHRKKVGSSTSEYLS